MGSGAALLVGGALTARRPESVLGPAEHLAGWQRLHDGIAPHGVVLGWLTVVRAVSRPLARRGVRPGAVTTAGVWLAAAALVLTRAGLVWPAAVAVVLGALADGVDGCVAVLTGRQSRTGARLDRAADRVAEALWLAALVVAGCPVVLAVSAVLAVVALEGRRELLGRPAVVTVAERPTRVLLVAGGLVTWPAGVVAVLVGLTAVGLVQLERAGGD